MKNGGVKKMILLTVDIAKMILIYLLTFSMLLFAGIYINMRQNSAIKTNMPTNKLRSLEHLKSGSSAQNDIFYVTPVEYVVKTKENTSCCFNNNELMRTLLEKNKDILSSLFKNNAVYEKKISGEGDKIWNSALGQDNFIYIKFANEFLPKFIYDAFTESFSLASTDSGSENSEDDADASGNETVGVYIYELIIVIDAKDSGEHNYYAVSRDKNAAVTVIYPHEEASKLYSSEYIIAYNSIEGLISCDFLRNYDEFTVYADTLGIKLPSEAVIFKEDTYADVLKAVNPLAFTEDNLIDTAVNYIGDLFDFLDFNLEKTTHYLSSDGVSTHISPYTGVLRFSKDGLIQYNAQNESEGLTLEKVLGFRPNSMSSGGDYSSGDKLAAACSTADIFREFVGSTVSLQLTAISFGDENGELVFTFSYYLNNILIYGKDKTTDALTVKIKNNTITEIKFQSLLFRVDEENIKNINQFLVFRQILNDFKSPDEQPVISSFTLNYFFNERGEKIIPKWTATGDN